MYLPTAFLPLPTDLPRCQKRPPSLPTYLSVAVVLKVLQAPPSSRELLALSDSYQR